MRIIDAIDFAIYCFAPLVPWPTHNIDKSVVFPSHVLLIVDFLYATFWIVWLKTS